MKTVNDILSAQSLTPFSLRAWLHHKPASNNYFPDWTLFHDWVAPTEAPRLCFRNLEVVDLDGAMCYVLHGKAVKPLHGRIIMTDDDEVEFIFVLNPSDPEVKDAVQSWASRRMATHRVGDGWGFEGEISVKARGLIKQDSGSDAAIKEQSNLLASVLVKLVREGRLETMLASKLSIQRPVYCTIVENELMLEAMAAQVLPR